MKTRGLVVIFLDLDTSRHGSIASPSLAVFCDFLLLLVLVFRRPAFYHLCTLIRFLQGRRLFSTYVSITM